MREIVPRAFLKKKMMDSAIVGYEQLLRIDPASMDRRFIQPVFHFRLARVCEQAGQREKALAEYRRFLEIWNRADAEKPELIDAKERAVVLGRRFP